MTEFPLLTFDIFLPSIGALLILFLFKNGKHDSKIKWAALLFSLTTFIISLLIYCDFSPQSYGMYQFEDKFQWFEGYDIYFHVGLDAISMPFILLTNLLIILAILCSWKNIRDRLKEYMILFLVLQTLILGAFSAVDIILFYVFFESVLIPMFFIIGIWGGENRVYASYKFFLYTLFGSVLMLVAIIYACQMAGSGSMPELVASLPKQALNVQLLLWIGFFASFAVKVPMIPLHTWLPDAHVQAPTAGSVVLAGILLKMGGYGFLRISMPMLPHASHLLFDFVAILSVIAIIYASLLAFAQTNMKRLIAYSSIAHMGFVTIAIFSGNVYGVQGAIFQMVSHGLVSAGLFLVVGMLSERSHTKEISKHGGVAYVMPNFAIIFAVFMLASVALPGTSGFIGEFFSLISIFSMSRIYTILAASGMILGAAYMLYLYKRVMFGKVRDNNLSDVSCIELAVLVPLLLLIVILGIYPSLLSGITEEAAKGLVFYFQSYK